MRHDRTDSFCDFFGLKVPILLAPMAGVPAPELSVAIAGAGGMGACGALLMSPAEVHEWAEGVRPHIGNAFQLNLWVPDPEPVRSESNEARVRDFLGRWGPAVPVGAGDAKPPEFEAQFEALIAAAPRAVSSIMGLYDPAKVLRLKQQGIAWFATVTTVAEAREAQAAGADVIVAQGAEAGGHRGSFDASHAVRDAVGLFALLPAVVDAVSKPVIATGGIADARGIAAAIALGASAVQIGTGFLRCPEAAIPSAWADALVKTAPEDTVLTSAFSGRQGRSIATAYVRAAMALDAPTPAPYPIQRGLTAAMRGAGKKSNDLAQLQAWAGQSAALSKLEPAASLTTSLWSEAKRLLA